MQDRIPKMMLGFVIRRCAVDIGHDPDPREFAAWANAYRLRGRTVCLFGRPISIDEARLILRHRGRPVAVRSAAPGERLRGGGGSFPASVVSLAEAKARLQGRGNRKVPAGRR